MDEYFLSIYARLERHYLGAVPTFDRESLLDMVHTLRLWAESKKEIDKVAVDAGVLPRLRSGVFPRTSRRVIAQHRSSWAVFSMTIPNLPMQIGPICDINAILSRSELVQLHHEPKVEELDSLADWLGRTVCGNYSPASSAQMDATRERLIRRVANAFGASHVPSASSSPNAAQLDEFLRSFGSNEILGLPVAYYQLLETAFEILRGYSNLFAPGQPIDRLHVEHRPQPLRVSVDPSALVKLAGTTASCEILLPEPHSLRSLMQ